eukprot:g2269.t1
MSGPVKRNKPYLSSKPSGRRGKKAAPGQLSSSRCKRRTATLLAGALVLTLVTAAAVYAARESSAAMEKKNRELNAENETEVNMVKAMKLLEKASKDLKEGSLEDARDGFQEFVNKFPDSSLAWERLGAAHFGLEDNAEALRCFDEAVKLSPSHGSAVANRARTLEKLGRDKDALNGWHRAVLLESSKAEFWVRRGDLLLRTGKVRDAIKSLNQAMTIQLHRDQQRKEGDAEDPGGWGAEALGLREKAFEMLRAAAGVGRQEQQQQQQQQEKTTETTKEDQTAEAAPAEEEEEVLSSRQATEEVEEVVEVAGGAEKQDEEGLTVSEEEDNASR